MTHTLEGHRGYDCILLRSMVPILLSHLGGSDLGIKARLPVRQPSTRGLPEYLGVATDLTNPVAVSPRDSDQPDLQSRA